MAKLKVQLHLHTKEDPLDSIRLNAKQVIDLAARQNYDVLAITCHNVLIFNEDLKEYAEQKRILLIPGIEKTVERKHVVIINATVESQKINSFEDLKEYRKNHPECLILAPHPYYPGEISLGKKLALHHELFDAVEYSWFHSVRIDLPNKKAVKSAEKYKLPVLATSDCHLHKYMDYAYSYVTADKNTKSVLKAIKENKIHIVSHNLRFRQMLYIYAKMSILELIKKITLR